GQWMLTALIETCGQAQHFILSKTEYGLDAMERWSTFSEGASFVDYQDVYLAQVFDGGGIAKQYAAASSLAGGNHD
ncbi:hypothetical protein KMS84_40220, partial [Streptomyces sp. IBSBF 2807]|nr:hypothetical protein [Streptomyces hilarionis]